MTDERRASGFLRLGSLSARSLGLPDSRARALDLESAWVHAAGATLARRARIRAFRRGILEIEVVDPAWRTAVSRLLPEIGARLARERPDSRIRDVRLVDAPSR
jgi:Dna[CI] antecedent DciA-like protein